MNAAHCLSSLVMLVFWGLPTSATDFPRINRTIAKEPTYESKPKYCLLVFGPEAKTRIWLALDPEARLLYVDCNGNGDLTEKGKRFEPPDRNEKLKNIDVRVFQIGEILGKNKKVKYTNLKVEHRGTEKGAEGLRVDESFAVTVEVNGKAWSARVKAFADSPKEAPVIHFDGPLTFALFDADAQAFARGKEGSQLTVLIGTWGPDRGTFTTIPCDSVPPDVHPVAEIAFPGNGPEEKPIESKVVLTHRC